MVSIVSAAMAAVFTLGGVPVQTAGATSVLPMQPSIDHPEVLLSTNDLTPATSVLMEDNSRWVVKAKQSVSSGVRVILVPPASSKTQLGLTVPSNAVDTPIWWVGEVIETPPTEDPGTEDPTNPEGDPTDPNTPPTDPETPPPPPENG